jgi:hypothetical protein
MRREESEQFGENPETTGSFTIEAHTGVLETRDSYTCAKMLAVLPVQVKRSPPVFQCAPANHFQQSKRQKPFILVLDIEVVPEQHPCVPFFL